MSSAADGRKEPLGLAVQKTSQALFPAWGEMLHINQARVPTDWTPLYSF